MVKENGMVMISETEYNELLKAKNRAKYGFKKEMPDELKQYLRQVSLFSSCGYIRSYYDSEAPSEFEYADSPLIHNFFSYCEEVVDALLDEDLHTAEWLIKRFVEDEFDIDTELN